MINLKLINSFEDIFLIKTGMIKKNNGKCYQVQRWIEIIFKIYYSAPIFFVIMFLFLLQPHYFDTLIMRFLETLVIYIFVELLLVLVLPIKKIPCWEKELQEKKV